LKRADESGISSIRAHHRTLTGGMKDEGDAQQGRRRSPNQPYVGLLPSQDIMKQCQQTCLCTLGKKQTKIKETPALHLCKRWERFALPVNLAQMSMQLVLRTL